MANSFKLTDKVATNALLALLKNNLVWGRNTSKKFTDMFGRRSEQFGDTINIRRAIEFVAEDNVVTTGTLTTQDVVTGSSQVRIDKRSGVAFEWTPGQRELNVDALLDDSILKGRMAAMAQQIESTVVDKALEFPNWVGTPGELIKNAEQVYAATTRLDQLGIPMTDRCGILTPLDRAKYVSSFTTATFYGNSINDSALEMGRLPMTDNIELFRANTRIAFTTGTRVNGAGVQVDGANQNVNYPAVKDSYEQTINIKGLAAGATVKRGEVFTIAGVFAVDSKALLPTVTSGKVPLPHLQQFKVLEDATADSTGDITLTIANPIIAPTGSGAALLTNIAYQTVSAAPANNALVTFAGAASTQYTPNCVWHKDAIQTCFVAPARPHVGEYNFATDDETGITIRVWATSDSTADSHRYRVDAIYGLTNYDRRLGTLLSGEALA